MTDQGVKKDVTIIIFAFNEEGNIQNAIDSVVAATKGTVDDYEIIVINDGSQDQTEARAKEKTKDNPRIRVVSYKENKGCGYLHRKGLELSTKTYVTTFAGDNDISWESLRDLIKEAGTVDLVTTYKVNSDKRSLLRLVLSKTFIYLMNTIFRINLRYYTGPFICRQDKMKSVKMNSNGLAAAADYIVRLLKSGCTHKEIPFIDVGRQEGATKALRPRSIARTFKTIFILFKDVYFTKNL